MTAIFMPNRSALPDYRVGGDVTERGLRSLRWVRSVAVTVALERVRRMIEGGACIRGRGERCEGRSRMPFERTRRRGHHGHRVNGCVPNPNSEDAAYWTAALEAYHHDLLGDAWDQIQPHGIGEAGAHIRWYRLIEAEAILRQRGEIVQVNEWLRLETVPEETLDAEDWIASVAVNAADAVARQLDWKHEPPVLLSILCRESEAPWAANPHGYWVNKEPYDKICLPFYLLDDETELAKAMAHEYAHVICGGLTSDHAPTWLHEAISMTAEQSL